MGNYGAKISQPGYDVKTCSDTQLIFSSAFKTMNVAVAGTSSKTNSSGSNADINFTITHGLSFAPYILMFYKLSSSSSYWNIHPGYPCFLSGDGNHANTHHIEVTSSNVVVKFFYMPDGETIDIKYYIFNVSL